MQYGDASAAASCPLQGEKRGADFAPRSIDFRAKLRYTKIILEQHLKVHSQLRSNLRR